MDLVVTVQVEENYGAHGGGDKDYWKPKGGVQWVFPIKPQTMFWMWDEKFVSMKLQDIATLESSPLFRYTVLGWEFENIKVMNEYDMEEIMES